MTAVKILRQLYFRGFSLALPWRDTREVFLCFVKGTKIDLCPITLLVGITTEGLQLSEGGNKKMAFSVFLSCRLILLK